MSTPVGPLRPGDPARAPAWLERELERRAHGAREVPATAPARRSPPPSAPGRSLRAAVVVLAACLAAAVAFFGGLGVGLGLDRGATDAPPATASASPAPDDTVSTIAASLLPSVVQLDTSSGLGSGVVYRRGGLILTAAHVVDGSRSVTVRLNDGTRVRGSVIGTDDATDVAVVRARVHGLVPAELRLGSPPGQGDLAVAIGSPFGLSSTVTAGVVSAPTRAIPTRRGAALMVQTDAPINPGNSGGALAGPDGRVIGINASVRTRGGENTGVGFAVPIDIAARVGDALVAGRDPEPGAIGATTRSPQLGRPGAVVRGVTPGSPAARAGLRSGDRVVRFDGEAVTDAVQLEALVRATPPGSAVRVTVLREGQRATVEVRVGSV